MIHPSKIKQLFVTNSRPTMKKILVSLLLWASVPWALADGLQSLDLFLQKTHTGQAGFTQVVTSPGRDGQAPRSKTSSGTFEFQRPGRFRFVYQKPFAQTIVADGRSLWLYDVDLNQVTQRAQAQALGSTPAGLLASAPDLQALRAEFTLQASAPPQDGEGLEWVLAPEKQRRPIANSAHWLCGRTIGSVRNFGQLWPALHDPLYAGANQFGIASRHF